MDLQPYSLVKSFQTHWKRIFNFPDEVQWVDSTHYPNYLLGDNLTFG